MCGRFTLTKKPQEIIEALSLEDINIDFHPRFNIAPTQNVLIVTDDGRRRLTQMRWGMIPSWAKDASIGNRMINARAETLVEKPAFREALRKRRCLVLADGFYEWKKTGAVKQPLHIVLKAREAFGFAGLWDTWQPPQGEPVRSCTIITTEANDLMRPFHDRMPVILSREAATQWLNPAARDTNELLALLKPFPADAMECYPVSRAVNSLRHDAPDCILPVSSVRDDLFERTLR